MKKTIGSYETKTKLAEILRKVRKGQTFVITHHGKQIAESERFLRLLQELPVYLNPNPRDPIFNHIISLAREHHLSSYDSLYLDLAMREGLPLATLDEHLKKAAKSTGVSLFK